MNGQLTGLKKGLYNKDGFRFTDRTLVRQV